MRNGPSSSAVLSAPRPGYDRLGVIGMVAMLVQATGAPAFSAACSGGSSGSQWTPRNRRPVTFPATSETSQRRGGGHNLWLDHLGAIPCPDNGRCRKCAHDSSLEGDRFELPVPRQIGNAFTDAAPSSGASRSMRKAA